RSKHLHNVEELLGQMTLQEKVGMLAGTKTWYTVPVERLGIPSLKMTDGPNGARGAGGFSGGVKATCFPAGIALASTWNTDLLERTGQALAHETKAKGAQVLLGPTVNIQRSPLGGRNFECFSESPYLLTEILRTEWGFEGVVMSDWFESVKSTAASVNAGLDLEMPEPRWRGEKLLEAVERGEVAEATIDTSVRRLLQLLLEAGLFEHREQGPEQALDLLEHRALIREAGAEGIVLLKNG